MCFVASNNGKYDLVNLALGGGLEELLRTSRERGESHDSICRALHDAGIDLTAETIRRWCRDLGIVTESTPAA